MGGSGPREAGERGGASFAPRTRVQRRPVHGVLLLDKPLGLSSNQALQKAKWLLRAEKAGHTGTLDPLATGVLPLCFGAATKFSQLHLNADKTYQTTVRLGVKTSTGDVEGDVIEKKDVTCTPGQVVQVLDRFTGPIGQVPPMHSALKKDGKALYEYARQGEVVDRPVRQVVIHELELIDMQLDGESPHLSLRVRCSKGTYIRTLGEDIGEALGCGGHLSMLRRVATGPFAEAQCVTLQTLESMTDAERTSALLPVQNLLEGHTPVILDAENAGRFLSGVRRRGSWADSDRIAVFGPRPQGEQPCESVVLLGS
ncbi:MAG: tRNA pseudouridine(55) synthase TruB, partial [Comamonadaceae bacterium]|nr:tRNA pseudouridine(55) synthase TruB [Comamonadaceae bacterium]